MSARISVVINTLNAEKWLAYALRSVKPWADEIVVVDMHSTDRTREIAAEFGAAVHLHERMDYVEPAREFAVGRSAGDWILVLDADELVPEPLSRRLREFAVRGEVDAVSLPHLNYILGSPLLHTGWGPDQDRHWRFFRRGMVELPPRIHAPVTPVSGARRARLPAEPGLALMHLSFVDSSDLIERVNRYTTIEARNEHAEGRHANLPFALWRALREWGTRCIRFAGWRDGWRGLSLTLIMMFYRVAVAIKLREIEARVNREASERSCRQAAEELLMRYGDSKS